MKSDRELAREVFWHDKRELCRFLGQPFYEIPAGQWCIKPAVSVEGLGYGARRLDTGCPLVVQPWIEGEYLCVDSWVDGGGEHYEHVEYTAERDSWRFRWFSRALNSDGHEKRHEKIHGLLDTLDAPAKINTEWIGDYCIEAHARHSHELQPLLITDATHAVVLWDDETRGRLDGADDITVIDVMEIDPETEVAVDGYYRRGIVYVLAEEQALREALE